VPAVPPSRQGRAYRREEIEELLREALDKLMVEGTSFRDLSVEKLCGQVGMARSTFYVYFEDKSAMLRSLSAVTLRRLYSAQRSWIAKGRDVTRDDVREGMRHLFTLFLEDEVVMRAVGEASVYDAAIRESYFSGVHDYVGALERFIRKGRKEGWINDVHAGNTAAALAWMTERTVTQVAPGAGRRRIDSSADALANVVWATLFD
jgi:AcrR family transcriptional regulator